MYLLTKEGERRANEYIRELEAKRKEILDAGKDTAEDTHLPGKDDILSDIAFTGIDWDDPDGPCYVNGWGVTDNYDADYPLRLNLGRDFTDELGIERAKELIGRWIDHVSVGQNISETLSTLLFIGFDGEELCGFGFDVRDVAKAVKEYEG